MSIAHRTSFAAITVFACAIGINAAPEWDGNGVPDAGGNWSSAENWSSDAKPTSADTPVLGTVGSGKRTVVLDEAATVQGLSITQDSGSGVNELVLGADLTLTKASPLSVTAQSTNAVIVSLNGHKIFHTSNNTDSLFAIDGTWKMSPDSYIALANNGQQHGTQFVNNGALLQSGSTIGYAFTPTPATSSSARNYINNGLWTLDDSSFTFGGQGTVNVVLTDCVNNGDIVLQNGSKLDFGGLYNYGTILTSGGTLFGWEWGGNATLANRQGGTLAATAGSTTLRVQSSYRASLANEGMIEIGGAETNADITVHGISASFTNAPGATLAVWPKSSFRLAFDGAGANGNCTFDNAGDIRQGGNIYLTWYVGSGNGFTRRILNTGTWAIGEDSVFAFTTSNPSNGYLTGFDGTTDSNTARNEGFMSMDRRSAFRSGYLCNTGTMEMDSAVIGDLCNVASYYTLRDIAADNCGRWSVRGGLSVIGDTNNLPSAARSYANNRSVKFTQRRYAESSPDPYLEIGTNDTDAAELRICSTDDACVYNQAGTVVIRSAAKLSVWSNPAVGEKVDGRAIIENSSGATVIHSGQVSLRPNGVNQNSDYIRNWGNWIISSTAEHPASWYHQPAKTDGSYELVFSSFAGGVFGGSGVLDCDKRITYGSNHKATFDLRGDILVSTNGLEITRIASADNMDLALSVAIKANEGARLILDCSGGRGHIGGLKVTGNAKTKKSLTVTGELPVDIRLPRNRANVAGEHSIKVLGCSTYSGTLGAITVNGAEPDDSIVRDISVSYSSTGATLSFTVTDNSGTVFLLQ